jgi:hypothetical protein
MPGRGDAPSVDSMNTSSKRLRLAGAVLAAGGFCWVTKFVVIAATDGATSGLADTVTGVFYLTAVALMALGTAGVAVALLDGRHPLMRAAGAIGGLVAWWATYVGIEWVAQAATGTTNPVWIGEEIGIVATGAVLLTVGLLLARPAQERIHVDVAATRP